LRLSNIAFSSRHHHHRRNSNDKSYFNTKGNKQLELSSKRIVTKSIAFYQLCPIWSKKLSLGIDRIDKILVEHDSKYCIVGEAWQFSGRYTGYYLAPLIPFVGCWTCIKYARKFANISKKINKKANVTRIDFEPLIEYFMIHWNEKHMKIK
jgi:hypothetical protein